MLISDFMYSIIHDSGFFSENQSKLNKCVFLMSNNIQSYSKHDIDIERVTVV